MSEGQITRPKHSNVFWQVGKIFGFFINERSFYLLPLIIVLILIGIALFFAQSSLIAPFVYTLF